MFLLKGSGFIFNSESKTNILPEEEEKYSFHMGEDNLHVNSRVYKHAV